MTTVLWFPPSSGPADDPDPEATASREVDLVVATGPGPDAAASPAAFPAAAVASGGAVAVVGWGDGGLRALALAARSPATVERLVMVATPFDAAGFDAAGFDAGGFHAAGLDAALVTAKTLLLYGAKDPAAGPRHGKGWKAALPHARYEQVPGDGPLLIETVWRRALSHLAPGRLKRAGSR